jgi:hypothetical protein
MASSKRLTTEAPVSEPALVDEWIRAFDSPLAPVVQALREVILSAGPRVGEHLKWNHPAFFYTGAMKPFDPKEYRRYIAVFNVRSKEGGVLLVFPHGARVGDKTGLLTGVYADGRRLARFHSLAEVKANRTRLKKVLVAWLRTVPE